MTQEAETLSQLGIAGVLLIIVDRGVTLIGKAFDSVTRKRPNGGADTNQPYRMELILVQFTEMLKAQTDLVRRQTEILDEIRRELTDHRTILTRLEERERK